MNAAPSQALVQFRLHPQTRVTRNGDGTYLLVPAGSPSPLQIGSSFAWFLDALSRGTDRNELLQIARANRVAAKDADRSVSALLEALSRRGCFDVPRRRPVRGGGLYIGNLDPLASGIVRVCRYVPSAVWLALLATAVGGSGWAVLHLTSQLAGAVHNDVRWRLAPLLLACAFTLWICTPIHELAHALACRAMGQPVTSLVLFARWRAIPALMVDVRHMVAIRSRWQRALVPAAGPLCDFLLAGALSGIALRVAPHDTLRQFLTWSVALQLFNTLFNLNPFLRTDGSWTYSILLGNYHLPEAARGATTNASPRQVWSYRLVWLGYLAVAVLVCSAVLRTVFR